MKIILSSIFVPIYLIILPIMLYSTKDKTVNGMKTLCGIVIHPEMYENNFINDVQSSFKKSIFMATGISIITSILLSFIPYDSIFILCIITNLIIYIAFTIFKLGNVAETLKKKKIHLGLYKSLGNISHGDLSVALQGDSSFSKVIGLVLLISSFLPMAIFIIYDNPLSFYDYLMLTGSFFVVNLFMFILGISKSYSRTVIISTDSAANANFNRSKNRLRALELYSFMAFISITCLAVSWIISSNSINMPLIIVLLFSPFVAIMGFSMKERKLRKLYMEKNPNFSVLEERELHYFFGVYNNPTDSRLIVDKPFGYGTTLNVGRPLGKFITSMLIIIPSVFIIVASLWLVLIDFTPMKLYYDGNNVTATQYMTDYKIPLNSIKKVELIESPINMTKISGSSVSTVRKGRFSSRKLGSLKVSADFKSKKLIFIETDSKVRYLISASDTASTVEIYNKIRKTVEKTT